MSANGRAILLVIPADGFREEEYKAAREALEKSGVKATMIMAVTKAAERAKELAPKS